MRPTTSNALVLYRKEPEQTLVEQAAQQVMDLFHVNAVTVLQVSNYYQMPECAKRALCETLLPVTLCKVAAHDGVGMWFFLSKEVLV
ncbi:MAG: hypothetical protein IJQ18_07695 [Paludibacteraceae bacterium]|jgi:hypothetical protein|nr:hypothetical protein [Paludibacteraceae bacterium]